MAMDGTAVPFVKPQYFTNDGDPANGYQLFSYAAGTTTKLSTYSDAACVIPNTNPIVLDSAGRASIFLPPGYSFKFVFTTPTDSDPPLSPVWTVDNVYAVPAAQSAIDISGTAGENMNAGQLAYLSDGSGSLTAGRWYLASSAAYYSSAGASKLAFAMSDTLLGARPTFRTVGRVTGLVGLSTGSVYYVSATPGAVTGTEPAIGTPRRVIGVADSTTSLVIDTPPIRGRVAYSTTTVGNVGGGEDTLYEYVAPAGELSADGQAYYVRVWGGLANNANAKQVTVRVIEGANNTVLLTPVMTAGALLEWRVEAVIMRQAATTMDYAATIIEGAANVLTAKSAINTDKGQTVTWANAVTIRISATGVANDDITVIGWEVVRRD